MDDAGRRLLAIAQKLRDQKPASTDPGRLEQEARYYEALAEMERIGVPAIAKD
jgi:hypothetical protein